MADAANVWRREGREAKDALEKLKDELESAHRAAQEGGEALRREAAAKTSAEHELDRAQAQIKTLQTTLDERMESFRQSENAAKRAIEAAEAAATEARTEMALTKVVVDALTAERDALAQERDAAREAQRPAERMEASPERVSGELEAAETASNGTVESTVVPLAQRMSSRPARTGGVARETPAWILESGPRKDQSQSHAEVQHSQNVQPSIVEPLERDGSIQPEQTPIDYRREKVPLEQRLSARPMEPAPTGSLLVTLPPKPTRSALLNNRSPTQAAAPKGYNSRPGKVDHYSPNALSPPRPRSLIDRLAQPNSDEWTDSRHRSDGKAYRGDREARRGAPYVRPAGRGMSRDDGRGWERR
jgi:hypothetical protein